MGVAVKSVYPDTHCGAFVREPGWKELLPAGCYGDHPAWYASAEAFEAQKSKTALIPWLLFNRHLWEEKAEALPGGAENLNLLVPHQASAGDHAQGWYVRLMVSEELEIQGLEAVSMNDESAPAAEGFQLLSAGSTPPPVAGPNRRRKRLFASLLLLSLSAALVGAIEFLFGTSSEQDPLYMALVSDLGALQGQEAALRSEWQEQQALGVSPLRVEQLLMDAMWLDAQVELHGQDVQWKGEPTRPAGMACDPSQDEGARTGWRNCWWEEA